MNRTDEIHKRLTSLEPVLCEIEDESHRHAGHAGARSGGGHYRLNIVSNAFAGKNALARHRMIHAALGSMMQDQIHALSIVAATPEEAGLR